jgi:hypothetical protein
VEFWAQGRGRDLGPHHFLNPNKEKEINLKIEELLAREGIRYTMERYVSAVDRRSYSELSEVFTSDGIIIFGSTARYVGRDEIIIKMTENAQNRGVDNEEKFQRHFLGLPMINLIDHNHARAVTYLFMASELGFDASGVYLDKFIKIEDRWLIAERRGNMEWGRPDSRSIKSFKPTPTPKEMLDIGFAPPSVE